MPFVDEMGSEKNHPQILNSHIPRSVGRALFAPLWFFVYDPPSLDLTLAAGTLLSFYYILGELKFDSTRQLLGTLMLMVPPLFVFNANSFMTDVPFLFWLIFGLWLSLRAFRLGSLT